jgi:hypothetical protein
MLHDGLLLYCNGGLLVSLLPKVPHVAPCATAAAEATVRLPEQLAHLVVPSIDIIVARIHPGRTNGRFRSFALQHTTKAEWQLR